MYYDLHIHTTKSDGFLTKNELLKKADNLGMEYISFTDHDYIETNNFLNQYINQYGKLNVKIIDGVEFTVSDFNAMHILGYDIKDKKMVERILEKTRMDNIDICDRLIKNLRQHYGFNLDYENQPDIPLTKNLIRRMLVDNGYAPNDKIAGNMYTGKQSLFYEKTVSIKYKDVIELINESGGIPVLAHPSTLKLNDCELDNLLLSLKKIGLKGIEIFNSSKTSTIQAKIYQCLALKYDLLTSSGSDYHCDEFTPLFGVNNDFSKKLIYEIEGRQKNV